MASSFRQFLDSWAAKRLGVSPSEITIEQLLRLRPSHELKRGVLSKRTNRHLRRFSPQEAEELARKGRAFLAEVA